MQQTGTDPWETLLPGSGKDVSAGGFLHHMSGVSQQWHKVLPVTNGSGTAAMGAWLLLGPELTNRAAPFTFRALLSACQQTLADSAAPSLPCPSLEASLLQPDVRLQMPVKMAAARRGSDPFL